MTHVIAKSENDLDTINELLVKNVPSYRQAYSDRTAWIMSCLSELVYIRFNELIPGSGQKKYFVDKITRLVSDKETASLVRLLDMVGYDHRKEREKLESELEILDIKLIQTLDSNGTQAMIVAFKDYLVLSFRGTEATSIKDIKSDARATRKECVSGGHVHSGFSDAYDEVHLDIVRFLEKAEYKNIPLFITGHSLGGALATVAAKRLKHQGGLAACYTFGSPRVGDPLWIESIKTPVYRIVNAADCVPMLPPSSETIELVSFVAKWIPGVGKALRDMLITRFGGYLHCGDMRYLSNCPPGDYGKVQLLPSVSLFWRIKGFIYKKMPWKQFLSDHAISVYRKKLTVVAQYRNKD